MTILIVFLVGLIAGGTVTAWALLVAAIAQRQQQPVRPAQQPGRIEP